MLDLTCSQWQGPLVFPFDLVGPAWRVGGSNPVVNYSCAGARPSPLSAAHSCRRLSGPPFTPRTQVYRPGVSAEQSQGVAYDGRGILAPPQRRDQAGPSSPGDQSNTKLTLKPAAFTCEEFLSKVKSKQLAAAAPPPGKVAGQSQSTDLQPPRFFIGGVWGFWQGNSNFDAVCGWVNHLLKKNPGRR